MRFTKYNSLADIMRYPRMEDYLKIFYSENLLNLFPEERKKDPLALAEHFGSDPWGEPFSVIVDKLLDAANLVLDIMENKTRVEISLWDENQESWNLKKEERGGKEQAFLLAPAKVPDGWRTRPAVIICPGGGYETVCFSGEGTPVLHYMEAKGYGAFVLKYRVAPSRYPDPQLDLALAIRYVRANAEKYRIDPDNILALGASAGGHLCALTAAVHEELQEILDKETEALGLKYSQTLHGISARPDKLCLCYPVISFQEEQHEGSFQALTGGDETLRKALSVEELLTREYPKTFVWACADDDCVPPSNAVRLGAALASKGVPYELHIYSEGGHGCGLAFSREAYEWSGRMINFFE